jgi:hypothetical protein
MPSLFELLHGQPQGGRPGANVCPRPASSGSFEPSSVSPEAERKRHGEHRDFGALALGSVKEAAGGAFTSRPVPSLKRADGSFYVCFLWTRRGAQPNRGYRIPRT